MRRTRFFMVLCALGLAGCANTNSIYRTLDLGGKGIDGVAIDAKQRGIYSGSRTERSSNNTVTTTFVCAEPSPDALSAYSLSGALTGVLKNTPPTGNATDAQVQAAMAAGEAAASIGLRTQSIQLLRDGLFSNCIAYMNGAVTGGEFYLLQRRSQNFTLGLLAIEQLTGVVRADQVALNTASSSATGSDNTDKENAALQAAQSAQNEAKTAYQKSQVALATAKTASEAQNAKVVAAQKKYDELKATKNPDDATKKSTADALETLNTEKTALASKQTEAANLQIDTDSLGRTSANADAQVTAAQEALTAAKMRVRASASGSSAISRSGGAGVVVTDRIAAAVVDIVNAVLKESGLGEQCNALIDRWTKAPPNEKKKVLDELMTICTPAQIKARGADAKVLLQSIQ